MSAAPPTLPAEAPAPVAPGDPRAGRLIAYLVAGTFFMENFDATVITTAVPAMARSFGVAPVALSAGVSAYLLALAVFIPASGWVADRFGARRVFATAIVLFSLASLACGLAQSLPAFVAARIVQGIGGALMVPVGRALVLRSTPKSGMVRAIAIVTWPGLAAPLLGPPLGGWIAATFSWHWIFFINLPLGLVALLLALRWIDPAPGLRRPFDLPGFLTSGSGLAALMIALEASATDLPLAAALAGFGLAALAYAVWHMRRAAHPLMDLSVFGVRTFRAAVVGGTLSRSAISSAPFLLPLFFQLGLGYGMVQAGFFMLALFAGNFGIKPATTWILRRFGFRNTLLINGALAAASFVGCALLSAGTPLALTLLLLVFGGVTRSMQFTAIGTLAFCDTTPRQTSGASTLFSTFQQLSAALGIALGAAMLRLAGVGLGHQGGAGLAEFRVAFWVMAVLILLSLLDAWRLPQDAGAEVSGHRRQA